MNMKTDFTTCLKQEKIIAIVRGLPPHLAIQVGKALYNGGIRFIEVTFNQSSPTCLEDTPQAIKALRDLYDDWYVGAGTVLNMEQLQAAIDAGSQFIISPHTDATLIQYAVSQNIPSMPGAMTPTEIALAYESGATFVKLFPTEGLGADYMKAFRAPLSHIPILAVGGVDLSNMERFYRAGACGFGIGGCLVNQAMINSGDFEGLTALAKQYVAVASSL